jgi:glucoamylase
LKAADTCSQGHHLFTLLSCLRALQAGSILALRLDDPKAAEFYTTQAERIKEIVPAFWDEKEYWLASSHIDRKSSDTFGIDRTGLDCAFPLSVIHAGSTDLLAAQDSETLATIRAYIRSFSGLYRINDPPVKSLRSTSENMGRQWRDGWAVGRYAEDVYNGIGIGHGNPW